MHNRDNLTERDIKVLMALEENPLATFDSLAAMTGLAKSVVFNIYQNLEESKAGFESLFSVTAVLNHSSLGMKVVNILVQAPTVEQFDFLKELGEEHPYTLYRSLIYGERNGFFLQFHVPIGSESKITTLFNKLQKKGLIGKFDALVFPNPAIYTTTRVRFWNHQSLKWDFDWKDWFEAMSQSLISDNGTKDKHHRPRNSQIIPGSTLKWIKKSDLYILKEMVKNSRRKKIDLIEAIDKSRGIKFTPQTFSRRLKKVETECIVRHKLDLAPKVLDLHTTILIWATAPSPFIKKFANSLESLPIPFLSSFRYAQYQFLWYIHLPSTHLSDLLFHLKPYLSRLRFYFIDHNHSRVFYLFADAYDEKLKQWKDSEDFMVNNVLDYLEKWQNESKV